MGKDFYLKNRVVRIFSRVRAKWASDEERDSFKTESEIASCQGAELDQSAIAKFPTVEQMGNFRGKKEGQIKVFRQGMTPKAYSWKGGKWEFVGEVLGQQHQKKHYEGDRFFPAGDYDYIFDVQDDSGINKRLPYNEGQNPLTVAESFLNREGMNLGYKEQITDFIRKNTRGGGKLVKKQDQVPQVKKNQVFPIREYFYFKKMNMDGLIKKTNEINDQLKEKNEEHAFTESDFKHFNYLVNKLRDPKIYSYIKEFTSFEIKVFKKMLQWPGDSAVTLFDLARILILHHASQVIFSGVDGGLNTIVPLVGKLGKGPKILWTLYGKVLSNLTAQSSNSMSIIKGADVIFDSLKNVDCSDQKITEPLASFIMNFSSTFDNIPSADASLARRFIDLADRIISSGNLQQATVLKLGIALGNFVTFKSESADIGVPVIQKIIPLIPADSTNKTMKKIREGLQQEVSKV